MQKIFRPSQDDLHGLEKALASLNESYRALRLPHWPDHYFPPSVPYVGPVAFTEDEMVAQLCADLPNLL